MNEHEKELLTAVADLRELAAQAGGLNYENRRRVMLAVDLVAKVAQIHIDRVKETRAARETDDLDAAREADRAA